MFTFRRVEPYDEAISTGVSAQLKEMEATAKRIKALKEQGGAGVMLPMKLCAVAKIDEALSCVICKGDVILIYYYSFTTTTTAATTTTRL